jgi:hypothetical protein
VNELSQAHPLSGKEILFTRQRHEADRMGLHWDYRFVLGDKAYSWATKKEMPGPSKAILLFEQPIHDRQYALSKVVDIPKGNYGAGRTVLDFVRKAKVEGDALDPDKLIINTKDGQRFLLKKLDSTKYGDKAWLFKNLASYKEGLESTFTHDGSTYRVDDAIEASRPSKTQKLPITDLSWITEYTKTDPSRIEEANIRQPVLVTDWQGKKVVVDGAHRLAKAICMEKTYLPTRYVDISKLEKIAVHNKYLIKIASSSLASFSPDLTPAQMESLGVLRHKGSQYGEGTDKDNFFKVRASLDVWPDKWHNEQHPQGWYQWYKGYSEGKRTDDDERQMKRWISFKARHLAQLKKADPTLSDLSIQPKRRQALLNWGIAPGIDLEKELNKQASLSLLAMGLHATLGHVAQNVGMRQVLKSKALARHIANGFSEGVAGVVDTSFKGKAKRFASGALLPEVNGMHMAAHKAGVALAPHLNKMTLRQKAGLHMMVSGNAEKAVKRGFHNDTTITKAYDAARVHSNLPPLPEMAKKLDIESKKNPLVGNIIANIHKGRVPEGKNYVKGTPNQTAAILGGAASGLVDPALGGMNTFKNLALSKKITDTKLGAKVTHKAHEMFIKKPFEKGLAGKIIKDSPLRRTVNDVVFGPINTELKSLGKMTNDIKK